MKTPKIVPKDGKRGINRQNLNLNKNENKNYYCYYSIKLQVPNRKSICEL